MDGVSSQISRHWLTETCANRLLDSGKPGHIESSDHSAAKKTDGYQGKGCPCWISSGLTLCADRWLLLLLSLYLRVKNRAKSMHLVKFSVTSRGEFLCKLNKEYLNALTCKFYTFFQTKFWHITRLFPINCRKVIISQKQSFLGHLVVIHPL